MFMKKNEVMYFPQVKTNIVIIRRAALRITM